MVSEQALAKYHALGISMGLYVLMNRNLMTDAQPE